MNEYFSILGITLAGLYLVLVAIAYYIDYAGSNSGFISFGRHFAIALLSIPAALLLMPLWVSIGYTKVDFVRNFGNPSIDTDDRKNIPIFFISCIITAISLYLLGYAIANLIADTKTAITVILAVILPYVLIPLVYFKIWLKRYRLAGIVRVYETDGYLRHEARYVGNKLEGLQKEYYKGQLTREYYVKSGKSS